MADFPAPRLLQADATLDEVAQLREEFRNSDVGVQAGIEDLFKGMSAGGIRDWLRDRRDEGHFGKDAEAPDATQSALDEPRSEDVPETPVAADDELEDEDVPDSLGSADSEDAPDSLEG